MKSPDALVQMLQRSDPSRMSSSCNMEQILAENRGEEILKCTEEQKRLILHERFEYNRAQRNQATRLLTAAKINNPNGSPRAAGTTTIGDQDASNRMYGPPPRRKRKIKMSQVGLR